MVREILQISVGQCGNQIGKIFWQNILEEHQIAYDGRFTGTDIRRVEKLNVYMAEIDASKRDKTALLSDAVTECKTNPSDTAASSLVPSHIRYVPRSVLLDLEPGVIDSIKASPMGPLFAPDFMVYSESGAGNNWAKGHYVAGAEIIDEAMDCVRKYVEDCECLQGFQLTQALGGGTGSGFGTLVLNHLRDLYPDRISCTYSVYPSPKVSDIVVEPYNALLSIAQLMESSDETFVIDNQSLMQISSTILKQASPSFEQLNWVISLIMSGVTASLRFGGLLNGDLRKMATNLVPFPRLHFFSCSFAPLFVAGQGQYTNWSTRAITEDIWRDDHFLADIHQLDGKYLSCCVNYRAAPDDVSSYEVDHAIASFQDRESDHFVSWIPHNVKTSIISIAPPHVSQCAALVSNTTSIKSVFMRVSASFALLFKRKAFLHWYTNEGMDEMEFIEADAKVRDLVMEYQEKQDAIYMPPSPPSSDDEMFAQRMKHKNEEEKTSAFLERKLKKLQRRMEKETKMKEVEEKNKGKSVFGNINNVKRRFEPKFHQRPRPNPGGSGGAGGPVVKERAAIVWSDDEEDELDDEEEEEHEEEHEEEQEQQQLAQTLPEEQAYTEEHYDGDYNDNYAEVDGDYGDEHYYDPNAQEEEYYYEAEDEQGTQAVYHDEALPATDLDSTTKAKKKKKKKDKKIKEIKSDAAVEDLEQDDLDFLNDE